LIHVSGSALRTRQGRARAAFVSAGELLERGLQLGVNTVSFARVGAFALAHAGLCVAVVELEQAAGKVGGVIVFVLGNALVLVLEGLVVGIQTTRLVLFEFFARFLRAEGRAFVPLVPPASDEAMTGAHK
jgi:V/A-type H+-transporting ATPase subunit I